MTPDVQAALQAAQAAVDTAHASWWLVGATIALALIAIAALCVGFGQAKAANNSFRLEAEPVLVVTAPSLVKGDSTIHLRALEQRTAAAALYVITGNPALADGLVLRKWQTSDEPQNPPGARKVEALSGGQRHSLTLEIQNVGRSPAINVEVDWDLTTSVLLRPGEERSNVKVDPESLADTAAALASGVDLPITTTGIQSGRGRMLLPAIPPQASVYVRVENCLGGSYVTLSPVREGHQLRWNQRGQPREPITVVSPEAPFRLSGTT